MKLKILSLIVVVAFIVSIEYANAEDLKVVNVNEYIDSIGFLHIVGEVKNTSDNAYKFIELKALLYDENDRLLDTDFTYTYVDVLMPEAKTPFKFIISDREIINKVDRYEVRITDYQLTSPKDVALDIEVTNEFVNNAGYYQLIGIVKNNGMETSTFTQVIVTFYDRDGNVVDTDFSYTDPTNISRGESGTFEIFVFSNVDKIYNYRVVAESNQYISDVEVKYENNSGKSDSDKSDSELTTGADWDYRIVGQNQLLYAIGFSDKGTLTTLSMYVTENFIQVAYTIGPYAKIYGADDLTLTESTNNKFTIQASDGTTISCGQVDTQPFLLCTITDNNSTLYSLLIGYVY